MGESWRGADCFAVRDMAFTAADAPPASKIVPGSELAMVNANFPVCGALCPEQRRQSGN
jgi:hypothetical protein